jgi:hypothetical protein
MEKKNESIFTYLPEPITGKCYFFTKINSRNYQHLDVKHFSTLIDGGFAWCNFSAYMGCSEIHPNNTVYIDLRFIDARNLSNSNHSLSKNDFFFRNQLFSFL